MRERLLEPDEFRVSPVQGLTTVPMETLLCDDVVYKGQHFSGEPLERFPMVDIFRQYEGDPGAALEEFRRWMREWLLARSGWKIPKRRGGMANGSLCNLVRDLYRAKHNRRLRNFEEADAPLIDKAIDMRARHYFVDVFESIKSKGYDDTSGFPITCARHGDKYMIKNGHHRAAALFVLGVGAVKVRRI
jgi:hypothetical protein